MNEINPGLSLDEAHMDIPPMATLAERSKRHLCGQRGMFRRHWPP
jgi:hypothetical protein